MAHQHNRLHSDIAVKSMLTTELWNCVYIHLYIYSIVSVIHTYIHGVICRRV